MIRYDKIANLDSGLRCRLRSDLRYEYLMHRKQGFVECICRNSIKGKLVALGICDTTDIITTTILKRLIVACG